MFVLFTLSACAQQFKTPMFQPFDSKGWGPNAMTYNGRDLLIGGRDIIFSLNSISTGPYSTITDLFTSDGRAMLSRFPVPLPRLFTICGMAWEGECCEEGFLWIADSQNKEIVKLRFNDNQLMNTFKMDGKEPPKALKSLTLNGQYLNIEAPHGLTFDGQYLWIADARASKIYQLSTEDGSVVAAFNSPVKRPAGLAWDCESLWVVGYDTCRHVTEECQSPKLVKLDVKSGKVTQSIKLPYAITRPSALQWMKGNLWVADYSLNRVFIVTGPSDVDDDIVYTIDIATKQPEPPVQDKPEEQPQIEELPPLQFEPNPAAIEPPPPPPVAPEEPKPETPKTKKPKKTKPQPQEPLDLPDK
ncbi:MAG: hypothetical protein HQL02_03480 [Nitrospirae bacterium]|nr:hypothetical protein [Nitrospirota bacterium]